MYYITKTVRTDSEKLTDQYDGPCQILRRLNDVNYKIERYKRNQILHVNKLRHAYFPLQNVDDDDDDD